MPFYLQPNQHKRNPYRSRNLLALQRIRSEKGGKHEICLAFSHTCGKARAGGRSRPRAECCATRGSVRAPPAAAQVVLHHPSRSRAPRRGATPPGPWRCCWSGGGDGRKQQEARRAPSSTGAQENQAGPLTTARIGGHNTQGGAEDREKATPGPETTDPGQGAADLATGHQKLTNAAAGRCDLTTLVPIGRGSGGRGQEERAASSGMLSTDPGFTGTDGPSAGDRVGGGPAGGSEERGEDGAAGNYEEGAQSACVGS